MERSTIHLLHKRGKSQREIASELGRSRSAVARVLSEPVDRQPSARRRKSSVDAFREQIAEWLKQGLSGVRMMELAREDPEHPYRGCGSVWRAAVRRERLSLVHEQAVATCRFVSRACQANTCRSTGARFGTSRSPSSSP